MAGSWVARPKLRGIVRRVGGIELKTQVAARVEPSTGVEHRIEYVPTSRGRLYVYTSRPREARACVLICSSIFGDFTANYHRERLLGQAISANGHAVMRFHYAGEGNSHGDRQTMTLETLCDDARAVMEHGSSIGFDRFALLGTRIGALVAATVISSKPAASLAFWEPVVDAQRFVGDAQRAKRMSQMAQAADSRMSQWQTELEQNGVLDLLGYDVYPEMVKSLEGVDLVERLGPQIRPIFIARFRGGAGERDHLAEALAARGFPVRTGHFGLAESWWFEAQSTLDSNDLYGATTDWLSTTLAGEE